MKGTLRLTILLITLLVLNSTCYATSTEALRREQLNQISEDQKTLRISAVGDLMFHMPQVESAYNQATKQYEFDSWFRYLTPWFNSRDFVIGNLETTLWDNGPYRGYPSFRSPSEAASDLLKAGFNVLTTANNHAYDTGYAGVESTIRALKEAGIAHTGTRLSADTAPYILLEKKGFKVALFAYTYSTNGITVPADKAYAVQILSQAQIKADLSKRPDGVDFTIVSLHFGNEYQRTPHPTQQTIVDFLKTQNVDVVLGSHPHVLQPDHLSPQSDFYVIYSMGNFISNQRDRYKDSGVVVNINLTKTKGIKKIAVDLMPTWVDKDTEYHIVPLFHRLLYLMNHLTNADLNALNQSKNDFTSMYNKDLK